jgi:HK97 family phage portal protein
MKFRFPFFGKKKALEIDLKSWLPIGALTDFLDSYGHSDLAAYTAVKLFNTTAPVANGINIISNEIGALIPQVVDENKNNEVIPNHPVLELLKTPNSDSTTSELLYSMSVFWLITGNSYLVATGPVNKPPLELSTVFPQQITIQDNPQDGLAELIISNTSVAHINFRRHETGKRFRFYHFDEREIWHIKRFNPNPQSLVGQSLLSAIYPEIDQYNYSSIHNASLLKRGGRPSGILMMNALKGSDGEAVAPLTESQESRLKAQINNFVAGAQNAGKVLAVAGANMKWENLITTNRDMDFEKLKVGVQNSIYNRLDIPLPFINPERQTFANMGLAKEQLYDNAIFHLADRLFEELNIFLMPRYGRQSENLKLTYDKSAIPALQNRRVRQVESRKKLGIFTDNELRRDLGEEPYDGGDVIYKPGNEVPVGEDAYTGDEPPVPKTTKKRFVEIMKRKGYSENKIEELAVIYKLK